LIDDINNAQSAINIRHAGRHTGYMGTEGLLGLSSAKLLPHYGAQQFITAPA